MISKKIKILLFIGVIALAYFYFSTKHEYFSFDKVEYYKIHENEKFSEDHEVNKIVKDWNYPTNLDDELFIETLIAYNYSQQLIEKKYHEKLKLFFKQQSCSQYLSSMCIVHFRDILVFYKKEEISGIAKICFDCNEAVLIGTNFDTSTFGQCDKYEELKGFLAKVTQ